MSTPVVVTTRAELAAVLAPARGEGRRVGFVPTMGALHDGHAALLREARSLVGDGAVVASIFVNPTQFGEAADLEHYPRTLDADLKVCEREGVDVVFAPEVAEMYPHGTGDDDAVMVRPGPLAKVLEGRSRKGHYRGVLTVVAKLFGLVRPDVAIFGQKDYQQLVLIRRMVEDLCMGVDVVGAETVREPDGAATSTSTRTSAARPRLSPAPCTPQPRTPSTAQVRPSTRRVRCSASPTGSTWTTSRSPPPTSTRSPRTPRRAPRPASSSPPGSGPPDSSTTCP